MGAAYSFYVKTIETHARAFFKVIIFSINSVQSLLLIAKNFFIAYERTFVNTPFFWKDGGTESTDSR